jgi:hypothetical protein
VACEAAGLDPSRLRTLAAAEEIGWGQTDLSKIEIAGLPLKEARLTPLSASRRWLKWDSACLAS